MTNMIDLKKLWEKLKNTPVNEDGEIEESFGDFETGTHIYEIWYWFEEQNRDFIVGKMMNGE